MLESSGKRLLSLGMPLTDAIASLRGDTTAKAPTFDTYSKTWLQAAPSRQSRVAYRNALDRARPVLGKLALDAIDLPAIKRLVASMKGYSPASVKQTVTVVKAMLNDAADDGLIANRPLKRIKTLPKPRSVRAGFALTREQHDAIVAHAPERFRAMFAVWPWLGLRLGEMVALEKKDREGERLFVRRQLRIDGTLGPPKGGKGRRIDLTAPAGALLEGDPHGPLMFPGSDGRYIDRRVLIDAVRAAGEAAGVAGMHSHIWRHTCGSWMLESGAPITYVAARLGDTPTTLMRVYAHEIEAADNRGAAAFGKWAAGDIEGTTTAEGDDTPA